MLKVESLNEFKEKDGEVKMLMIMSNTCGGCAMQEPIVDKISEKTGVPSYKINGPENMDFMMELGIMSVPVMVYYKNNEVVKAVPEFRPEPMIIKELEALGV